MSPSEKPRDYHERRRWQDAARARGELPECGRAACTAKADPAWVNSGTPLLYCSRCAHLINSFCPRNEPVLCTPEMNTTAIAYAQVLYCGLPVVVTRQTARGGAGRTFDAIWIGELDGERFVARRDSIAGSFSPGMEQLGEATLAVDLLRTEVVDRVSRVLWASLLPDDPVTFACPTFHHGVADGVVVWWLVASGSRSTQPQEAPPGTPRDGVSVLAAALASVFG